MVNFQALVKRLNQDHSLQWIADRCDVPRGTLQSIKDGQVKQPRYALGVSLVELEKRTRKQK